MSGHLPLLFLGLLGVAHGLCPPQGGAYAQCSTTVVYILDLTTDLNSTEIDTELDWIRNHILPGTAFGTSQQLALMSYGTGNAQSYDLTGSLAQACKELDAIQNAYGFLGSFNATLLQTMKAVDVFYGDKLNNMVLFTASKNLADISDTASYIINNMATKHITVIAMAGANFSGFPATVIYDVPSLNNYPPNLPSCIIKNACNQGSTCDIYGVTDAPVWIPTTGPTTLAPTTSTTTRAARVTTSATSWIPLSTGAPGPVTFGPSCGCNYSTVWLDIMFVMDASQGTTEDGLDQMWATGGTIADYLNLTTTSYNGANPYTTRMGIVTYGNSATTYKTLGSLDNNGLENIFQLPYNNDANTNLEAGLQAAVAQFQSSAHRSNYHRVIIVMASTYNPAGQNAPQQAADSFKESGGIILVYNYVQAHTEHVDTLQEIASPGYFYTTADPKMTYFDVLNGLCEANCFCPVHYVSYTNSPRNAPTSGCYQGVDTPANQRLASNKCKSFNSAYLANDQTADKNVFLSKQFQNTPNSFYISVVWDAVQYAWTWGDGTRLGSYQPWAGGSTPVGNANMACVFVNPLLQWQPTDCRNGYLYVCEAYPCDSLHYCP